MSRKTKLNSFPKEWLKQRLTVEEAESSHTHNGIVFGFIHNQWELFKSKMLPEDELWEFRSPPESWDFLAGRAGYVILRGDKAVATMLTEMN